MMKCPVCKTVDLVMSDRNGIEIDYCPQCRGVWLDRGELDKIIERAAGYNPAQHAANTHATHTPPPPQGSGLFGGYNQAAPSHHAPPPPPAHHANQHYPQHNTHSQPYYDPHHGSHSHHHNSHYGYKHHKKRESFWDDLFDFD